MYPLDYVALLLITLIYYLFLKSALDVMTYKKLPSYLLLAFSAVCTLIFIFVSVPMSLAVLVLMLGLLRINWKDIIIVTIVAGVGLLLGTFIVTAALAVIGTALHIPGYELHGSLRELMYRAMGGG